MTVIIENRDPSRAAPLFAQLRAALEPDVLNRRLAAAIAAGYRVIGAEQNGDIVGVIGYRITHDISWGKTLYSDDLNIAPTRRDAGICGQLLEAALAAANTLRCNNVRLCSGLTRSDAHRFYEAHNIQGFSKQFVLKLEGN